MASLGELVDTHKAQRHYHEEVASLAESILGEAREYDRDVHECLHETIDGHSWVIYTYDAKCVAMISDNSGYAEENFGPLDENMRESQIAFGALYADVSEKMLELGWDGGENPPSKDDDAE